MSEAKIHQQIQDNAKQLLELLADGKIVGLAVCYITSEGRTKRFSHQSLATGAATIGELETLKTQMTAMKARLEAQAKAISEKEGATVQ